jgi:Cu/Ag efflux pump CusA
MVDAAIVVTENAYQAMVGKERLPLIERAKIIKKSTLEVGKPIAFAVFIIMLSFIPIFSLQGMEGKLFSPLAWTNIFAMLGALLAALFLIPCILIFVLKGKMREDKDLPVVRFFQKRYGKLLTSALRWRKATLGLVV